MNYENMSDFEINGYVSMHMHGFSWIEFVDGCVSSVKLGNEGSPGFAMVEVCDYCSNPSDAWPIIFDNEISMCKPRKSDYVWNCFNRNCDVSVVENLTYHQNPLRAAMIVFLKMQEANRG